MQSTAYSVLAQIFQGKVPSLVKTVSPISEEAGTKIFEGLWELFNPDMESAKHQKAKEMQKMLDECLPEGQDFKTPRGMRAIIFGGVYLSGILLLQETRINRTLHMLLSW